MWLLAIPLALVLLLLVLVAGLIGLIFGAVGLIVGAVKAMPWLLILLGAWLLLRPHGDKHRDRCASAPPRDQRRPQRREQHRARPQPVPSSPSAHPVQYRAPHSPPAASPRREIPIDVQVKVEQIRRKADVLLGYADRFPPFSQDLYLVRQTAAEYLPRTTAAYLALPGVDDPVVAATGKTALQELREQLQLLDSKLDDIAQDLQRQDLDHLLANRRFLEERFKMRDADAPTGPLGQESPRRETDAA